MENKEMISLTDYCKDVIQDNIHKWVHQEMNIDYLSEKICESMKYDGTATYSRSEAEEYLKNWWDDCGDYIDYLNDNGISDFNPFNSPEKFMVWMVMDGVRILLNNAADTAEIETYEEITITNDIINTILEEIEYETITY